MDKRLLICDKCDCHAIDVHQPRNIPCSRAVITLEAGQYVVSDGLIL